MSFADVVMKGAKCKELGKVIIGVMRRSFSKSETSCLFRRRKSW